VRLTGNDDRSVRVGASASPGQPPTRPIVRVRRTLAAAKCRSRSSPTSRRHSVSPEEESACLRPEPGVPRRCASSGYPQSANRSPTVGGETPALPRSHRWARPYAAGNYSAPIPPLPRLDAAGAQGQCRRAPPPVRDQSSAVARAPPSAPPQPPTSVAAASANQRGASEFDCACSRLHTVRV
jgi:hypothetical protein